MSSTEMRFSTLCQTSVYIAEAGLHAQIVVSGTPVVMATTEHGADVDVSLALDFAQLVVGGMARGATDCR